MAEPPLITHVDAALVERVLTTNPRCQRLNLSYNAIEDVDSSLVGISATLRALDLSHNRLRELGPAFGLLEHLHTLLAAGNEIESMAGLAGCVRLQRVRFGVAETATRAPTPHVCPTPMLPRSTSLIIACGR